MFNEEAFTLYNIHNLLINDLGNMKEIYFYESPTVSKKKKRTNDSKKRITKNELQLTEEELIERQRKRKAYYKNKKNDIQRLIHCNMSKNSFFLTLTYACETSLNDVDKAFYDFKYFITKLNKHYYKDNKRHIKYIAAWEFKAKDENGDKSKDNTRHLHFHAWIDFPSSKKIYIRNKDIAQIWGHGFINIRPIITYEKNGSNLSDNVIQVNSKYIGLYLTKYICSDLEVKYDLKGRKALLISRNLTKPKTDKRFIDLTKEYPKQLNYIRTHPEAYNYRRQSYNTGEWSKATRVFLSNDEYEKLNIQNLLVGGKSNEKQ